MRQSNAVQEAAVKFASIMKEAEERGAAREREKYVKVLKSVAKALIDGAGRLTILSQIEDTSLTSTPQPQPKKRKAVEANEAEYDAVAQFFQDVRPAGSVVTVKTIHRADIGCGPRIIAAACRMLVAHGEIEAVGRKGYRLAQRKENGLDETTLPSE